MKRLVLSRKGFDSSVGGAPSPVLEDGRLASLPIPSKLDRLSYEDLRLPAGDRAGTDGNYAALLGELNLLGQLDGRGAHADPDLIAATRPRQPGWKPSLGQMGAAAGHLRNQGVESGDLFLFYGWFRFTERRDGVLTYSGDRNGFHCIFGYLRVGEVQPLGSEDPLPDWALDHPHAMNARRAGANNLLYCAAGTDDAGLFCYRDALRLSKPGLSRSCWQLDQKVFRGVPISYHSQKAWREDHFRSYPRAQEYVVHTTAAVRDWAESLIDESRQWGKP